MLIVFVVGTVVIDKPLVALVGVRYLWVLGMGIDHRQGLAVGVFFQCLRIADAGQDAESLGIDELIAQGLVGVETSAQA
jgi:hypothetical protein